MILTLRVASTVARDKFLNDYIDDVALSAQERALCAEHCTVRLGHARRRCWAGDEVRSMLEHEQL
jgi:hypothetical protein